MKRYFYFIIIVILAVARMALININSAEWGDSYRILRASNYVRQLTYPSDEKRPPLFSALLAIRPNNVDAIFWGRLFMLVVTFATLFVFYLLTKKYLATHKERLLALAFLFFNPVFLYWSLRIYADVFFGLLVMLCFYIFEIWRERLKTNRHSILILVVLGLLCGLAILTRFEGYLLAFSIFLGVLWTLLKYPYPTARKWYNSIAVFITTLILIVAPWIIYRNPLSSSYFEEPAGRKYDLNMLLSYLASYIYILGAVPTFALIVIYIKKFSKKEVLIKIRHHFHIVIFVALESLLILAWPAAIPRLFIPIIPFLILLFINSLSVFDKASRKLTLVICIFLTLFYTVVQNKLRLQFLGPHTVVFAIAIILGISSTFALLTKKRLTFLIISLFSSAILAFSTIYLHKDVYKSLVDIATFPLREVAGKIIHNDTAGIIEWYYPNSEYKNFDNKKHLSKEYLVENKIRYVIITNEFNPNLKIDLEKRPYLQIVKASNYKRGGKMFFTWLVEVKDEAFNSNTLLQ